MIRDWLLSARQSLVALAAWLLGFPMTLLVKRDPGLTLVIGRRGPVFADNSKYFFVQATHRAQAGERVVFLAGDGVLQGRISDAGAIAVRHPSWRSLGLLLRCGYVVTDMADWFDFGAYQLSRGAKVVQLWHGAPLKHIELDLFRARLRGVPTWARLLLRVQKALLGRYPTYEVVVATSQRFLDETFKRSFKARNFVAAGYPRNDVLFGWPAEGAVARRLSRINVDELALEKITVARSRGQNVALYVPTFRKDMANPLGRHVDLARLSAFARRHNVLVVVKLHPFMHGRYRIGDCPNLHDYAPLGDVYPAMVQCDLLITDYSSIYFDFLLLDRPIVFFAPDLERYLSQDRSMYFSYNVMTPGAKCSSQDELESHLSVILANDGRDGYADQRETVRRFTHDHVDNRSAARLLEWLRKPAA